MARDLTLLALGDLSLGLEEFPPRGGLVPVRKDHVGEQAWLSKVAPVLQKGDFTFGNLEGLICDPLPDLEGRGVWGNIIRMPSRVADILKSAGFNAFSLANNHTMDLGPEGLRQTLRNLDRVGIAYSGAGMNIRDARKPALLEQSGVKVALLSYSSIFVPGTFPAGAEKPGIATIAVTTSYEVPDRLSYSPGLQPRILTAPDRRDMQAMIEDIRRARETADVVVVSCHWGFTRHANAGAAGIPIEDSPLIVLGYQEEVGRAAIDAGADVVFGHHPFWVLGVEVYKSKPICYCLGRLATGYTYDEPVFGEYSLILKGHIESRNKRLTRISFLPLRIPDRTQEPYVLPAGSEGGVVRALEKQSKRYGTRFIAEGGEIVIR